tara:strand:+ start:157 stop:822 length:666 start_codon:yes stop_codon:yes gene_type:complete
MNKKKEDLKNGNIKEKNSNENNKKPKLDDSNTNNHINENLESGSIKNKSEEIPTVENYKEEIEQLKEEKIRLLAEMENIRKRFEREKVESIKFGSINLAREILSPADNIERALSAISRDEEQSQSIKNLIDGLKMVQKEFSSILEKNEIKRIESLNKKFDPTIHQAMIEIEKDNVEEGIVVQEIQAGYTMHDRLLRPAMVGVSKKQTEDDNNKDTKEANDL